MLARRYRIVLPAIAVLLTLVAFTPSLKNEFLNWDDSTNFLQNNMYRGLGWTQLKWMWTSHLIGRYVPLTWMTLGLDYTIWKMNPFGYHLTNVLFHLANALVFYFLALALYRIVRPPSSGESELNPWLAALIAALIFAVHPLRVESVSWVTERRDVVSGLFYLLTLFIYVRGFDGSDRPIRRKNYWLSICFFALALLSKESYSARYPDPAGPVSLAPHRKRSRTVDRPGSSRRLGGKATVLPAQLRRYGLGAVYRAS